jgi:DNA-binding MarR family transcriptional regulator
MTVLADIPQNCACLHIRMTARAVTRAYDEALRPTGLKITQFALLSAIDMGIGGSISDLAERLAFERTTLTRNLQLLKDAGFITPRGGTGRAVAYAMTPKGQKAIAAAVPLWKKAQARIESRLGPAEWDATRQHLRALRKAALEAA